LNTKFIKILTAQVTSVTASYKEKIQHRPQNIVTVPLLQSGIVTIDEVPHAQQTSDLRGHHKVGYGA